MFDPINAPDIHRGPATGHSTEWGTTWHEAVKRINDAFKALFEAASTGVAPDFVAALEARFEKAEDRIADLEAKLAAYENVPTPPIPAEPSTDPVLPADPAA